MIILFKALVSALVVLAVNVAAQRNPTLGGWIAALPIISFLSVLWLLVDQKQSSDIAQFLVGVLLGLVPTAILLGVFALALRRGLAVPWAALSGVLVWIVITWVVRRTGVLGS